MHLKDYNLLQLDEDYIRNLGSKNPEALVTLSTKLLEDLIDARNKPNQNPSNSSRPSGSMAPWASNGTNEGPLCVSDDDFESNADKEGKNGVSAG